MRVGIMKGNPDQTRPIEIDPTGNTNRNEIERLLDDGCHKDATNEITKAGRPSSTPKPNTLNEERQSNANGGKPGKKTEKEAFGKPTDQPVCSDHGNQAISSDCLTL